MNFDQLLSMLDTYRREQGFKEMDEIIALAEHNSIPDPFSVLISKTSKIGGGNTFYPCVTLKAVGAAILTVGDGNKFFSGVSISAETGPITIGSFNEFGEGGFTAKTNRPGACISFGDHGRYQGGAAVFGESVLGSGSQLLGAVTVDSCTLGAGKSFKDGDPDSRGALLKGSGTARSLVLQAGEVIQANGVFLAENIKPQSYFHPKG